MPALPGVPDAWLPFVFLVGGVALLYVGAEWLIRGASRLGERVGVPPIIVGLTVVSIGTSAPEFVVSVLAALQGSPDIAIGNVLGSNLANMGLILGLGALLRPLDVPRRVLRRDIPWMIGVTLLVYPLMLDLRIGRVEAGVLCAVLVGYLLSLVAPALRGRAEMKRERAAAPAGSDPAAGRLRTIGIPLALVAVGSGGLALGGRGVVEGATELALAFGLPELLVGLSIVAVGTSLPELAAVVVAAFRKEADLALGNIVGSNIFNLAFVLGGTGLIHPIDIQARVLGVEYPAVLALSLMMLPLALTRRNVGRFDGAVFLALYGAAWWWIVRGG